MTILKQSLLSSAMLFSTLIFGQTPEAPQLPIDEVTKLITYTEVVDAPELNKDSLYNRCLRWFNVYFKNPSQAIKSANAEEHVIEGGYRFTIERPDPGVRKNPPMVKAGLVNFKMKVLFKDARYKYEVTNISWAQTSYFPIERWHDTSANSYDPDYVLYLQQTDKYIKEMIENMVSYIETDPIKKKEEW